MVGENFCAESHTDISEQSVRIKPNDVVPSTASCMLRLHTFKAVVLPQSPLS